MACASRGLDRWNSHAQREEDSVQDQWYVRSILSTFWSRLSLFIAFSTFLLALGVTAGVILRFGPESFTFLYDKWVGFVTASLAMSVVQSIYCYASSFYGGKLLALGGNSGNFIYDVSNTVYELGRDTLIYLCGSFTSVVN
jgi:hypothetical protein